MKKKIITIFMASMLAVTSLAGCASSESEKGGEDKAKEEGKSEEGDRDYHLVLGHKRQWEKYERRIYRGHRNQGQYGCCGE